MYQTISGSSRKKRSWYWVPQQDTFATFLRHLDQQKKHLEYLQDDPKIAKFKTCDFQTSRDESELCLNRDNDSQNLDAVCKTTNSTCSRKLRCNRINKTWYCQEGQHVYTDLVCCDLTCKEISPQPVVQNTDPLN